MDTGFFAHAMDAERQQASHTKQPNPSRSEALLNSIPDIVSSSTVCMSLSVESCKQSRPQHMKGPLALKLKLQTTDIHSPWSPSMDWTTYMITHKDGYNSQRQAGKNTMQLYRYMVAIGQK